jgi:hypothetical protein
LQRTYAETRQTHEATRGKYFKRYQQGRNVVVIDPDLAEAFPSSKAVNDASREVLSRRGRKGTPVK